MAFSRGGCAASVRLSNRQLRAGKGVDRECVVSKLLKLLDGVRKNDEGAAMAEYVVLLGLIVGVLVLVITNFADVLHTKFTAVCSALGGAC
jgi:Flp pilus assembly pilin Flp